MPLKSMCTNVCHHYFQKKKKKKLGKLSQGMLFSKVEVHLRLIVYAMPIEQQQESAQELHVKQNVQLTNPQVGSALVTYTIQTLSFVHA